MYSIYSCAESLVRLPEETRRAQTAVTECLRQTPLERMHAVMDAISCVSSCPWRVNRNVLYCTTVHVQHSVQLYVSICNSFILELNGFGWNGLFTCAQVMDVAGKMFADGGNKALALPHSEAHFNRLTNEAYKCAALVL